jgi:hypothetical protein
VQSAYSHLDLTRRWNPDISGSVSCEVGRLPQEQEMDNQAPTTPEIEDKALRRTPIDRHPIPVVIAFLIIVSIGGFALYSTEIGQSSGQSTVSGTLPH